MRKIIIFALFFLLSGFSFSARAYAGGFCFNRAGVYYNVPPTLLMAIARVESDFNPQAIDYDSNGSYDYGIMQINTVWYPEIRASGKILTIRARTLQSERGYLNSVSTATTR